MFLRIAILVFVSFLPACHSACHGSRTSYRAQFMGELVRDNKVLLGHVFATFPVQNFTQCFALCKDDCRCRSFNLPMTGQGICELNNADNNTVLMKPRRGWRYHHLEVKEVRQGADTCWEPYSNGCCETEPCHDASSCTETGDRGKPGFDCTCTTKGYLGPFCDRKIHSCLDYLWNDKNAASGYYDVWDKNDGAKYRVYCNMKPETFEAWTLVMSYAQSVKNTYKRKPLFVDSPANEGDATSSSHRLSLDTMESVIDGVGQDRELEWRATCDYSFVQGRTTNNETVRSRFSTLDIMKFTTNGKGLVGYYPFTSETTGEDKSGFGNDATLYNIVYEDGPLGVQGGSVRMRGSTSSYIRLHDNSGSLDTRYSITIMMHVYLYDANDGQLLGWATSTKWGVRLWQLDGHVYLNVVDRSGISIKTIKKRGFGYNKWNHLVVTYDYESGYVSAYVNGTLLRRRRRTTTPRELGTQNSLAITMGAKVNDQRAFNGRVACLKVYNTAFTDDDVKQAMKDWTCPEEPAPICNRVDYINIRGKECYDCTVWATQTNAEAFTINAHRGDQANGCNFKSGSTVSDENIFGVYSATDPATHACASSAEATTQYWFGGRL